MRNPFVKKGSHRGMAKWVAGGLAVFLIVLVYGIYSWLQKDVIIVIDKNTISSKTFKFTVAEVLEEKGIKVFSQDRVDPGLTARLAQKQVVKIIRAEDILVEADGKKIKVRSVPETVQNVLKQANVTLGEKDLVEPELITKVGKGDIIKVSRIKEEFVTKKHIVSFRTEQKEDRTLERGTQKVIREGIEGQREEVVKIVYKDNKRIRREIVSSRIIEEPVNKIVALGVLQLASRGGRKFEFERIMDVRATAYTSTGNRTCTGRVPQVGTIAVDPNVIPLGSRLYVDGYGFGRAEDTGGLIKGNTIDVFLSSEREARRWGVRSTKVYILK